MAAPKKRPTKKATKKAAAKRPARKPHARSATSPMDVLAQERRVEALRLRTLGHDFREIGQRLNVSASTAHGYVKDALAQLADEQHAKATELRAIEVARLDALMRSLWPWATGDTSELLRKAYEDAEARGLSDKELQKLIRKLPPAGVPDGVAAKRVLDCIVTRSRLQGLEAPIKHAHTNPEGTEERPPGSYVFPVPPSVDVDTWRKLADAAAKAARD